MPGDMKTAQEAWGPASLETWGTSRNERPCLKNKVEGGNNSTCTVKLIRTVYVVCTRAHAAVRSRMVAHNYNLSTGEVVAG